MANDAVVSLMDVQVAKEAVWGTPLAPTARLMGIESCELTPLVESQPISEIRGSLIPGFNSVVNRVTGEADMSGTVTYEDLPYLLDSLLGEATPAGTGPYTYTYAGPSTPTPTPRIFTLVRGGPEGVESLEGAIVDTLEISAESHAPASFTAHFIGEQVDDDALAVLSDRPIVVAHANDLALFVDDFGVAAGTTPYPTVAFSATLSLDMNKAVVPGLGIVTPQDWAQHQGDPGSNTLVLSLQMDNTAGASKDLLDELLATDFTPFQKVVRLQFARAATEDLLIDFAGFAAEAPTIYSDVDGIASLEFTLQAQYEATLGNWLNIVNTNQVATLV